MVCLQVSTAVNLLQLQHLHLEQAKQDSKSLYIANLQYLPLHEHLVGCAFDVLCYDQYFVDFSLWPGWCVAWKTKYDQNMSKNDMEC